jgi:uncharacterized membrane protein SpoIIM required for sporulation
MNAEQFYQERQSNWAQLSALLDRSRTGIHSLTPSDVQLLGQLYRSATSDLALAQREFPNHRVTVYVNQLVGRGHAVIYRSEPLALNRLSHFITAGFPAAYRQTLPFIVAATILFFLPAVVVGLAIYRQPETAQLLLPRAAQHLIPSIEDQELWTDIPIDERPYASSFIMTNNIQVSFFAFAGGVSAGLLTTYVLILNGLLLGGITGLTSFHGVGLDLWTFVIGHGVIEISTILIAGGSGLMMGWSIIHPRLMRRRDALALAARRAVQLIIGSVPLLVIAGLIEGFISPNEAIPGPVKWGVGIGSGLLLHTYLLLAGRVTGVPNAQSQREALAFNSR